jgi:uncharacterized protein
MKTRCLLAALRKIMQTFVRTVALPVSAAAAMAWHERLGALARLTPPWEHVELRALSAGVRDGARVRLRARVLGPLGVDWEVEHFDYVAGQRFCDRALRGPFAHWVHRHEFTDTSGGGCELRDHIEYALPGGALGRVLGHGFVERKLAAMFAYRHAITRADLALPPPPRPLRVLLTGASGLIGSALVPLLTTQGHTVLRLVRRAPRGPDEARWDPARGEIDLAALGEIDAVIHLAGAGVADARWTAARRRLIRSSRVESTQLLARTLAALPTPPQVVLGGSAVGFYGDTGDVWCDEAAAAGTGFLAEVVQAWEAAWATLAARGATRLVFLRTGVVLSAAGGALARMLPAFRCGLGGPLGAGRQWLPWVELNDVLGACAYALARPEVNGPLNLVAPQLATSRDFATTLGRVLRRPAILPAPAWALRLILGRGLAEEALLAGQRARPEGLRRAGYGFRHENLEAALRHTLGRLS